MSGEEDGECGMGRVTEEEEEEVGSVEGEGGGGAERESGEGGRVG